LQFISFKMYFEETKDIGSIDILVTAAEKVGLNKQSVKVYLESDEGLAEVEKYYREAIEERDIQDVPHFTIYKIKEIKHQNDDKSSSENKICFVRGSLDTLIKAFDTLGLVRTQDKTHTESYYCIHDRDCLGKNN